MVEGLPPLPLPLVSPSEGGGMELRFPSPLGGAAAAEGGPADALVRALTAAALWPRAKQHRKHCSLVGRLRIPQPSRRQSQPSESAACSSSVFRALRARLRPSCARAPKGISSGRGVPGAAAAAPATGASCPRRSAGGGGEGVNTLGLHPVSQMSLDKPQTVLLQ